MPMWFWYALAAWLGTLALGAGYLIYCDARRRGQIAKARAVLEAAADNPASTVRRLGTFDALVADVTASDYGYGPGDLDTWGDYFAGRSETPTFDRLCADVARREAAELDVEWEREAGA